MRVFVTNLETGDLVERELGQDEYPSQITVFCDNDGEEHTGDYVVSERMTSAERLEVARAHMRRLGWLCDKQGDFCPTCKADIEAYRTSGTEGVS